MLVRRVGLFMILGLLITWLPSLARKSVMGQVATQTVRANCDAQGAVWVCPPDSKRQIAAPGALLVPDSQADRVMSFDATTGELLNPNYIPADLTHLSTPLNAILAPDGASILVSDQIEDVVQRYALDGSYLGIFAPSTGVNNALLDNIRGITLRSNGNLLVTVGSGGNANAVAEFDPTGNYVGQFIAAGAGGLDSPYDVYFRNGDLLVSSNGDGLIRSFNPNTGAYSATLITTGGFPQQIAEAANGNVLTANFTVTNEGVLEYTALGAFVGRYDPPNMNSYRGVYELPNGNLLTTIPIGTFQINRNNQIVQTEVSGAQSRYIEHVAVPTLRLEKTVGLDPATCATTTQLTVTPGTQVVYCYRVINTGTANLTTHTLVDNQLGTLLSDFSLNLTMGSTAFITASATLTRTTANLATWSGRTNTNLAVQDSDSLTVIVADPTTTPTATTNPTSTPTASATITTTPEPTPTSSATPEPTATEQPTPTSSATPEPTATEQPTPASTATSEPSATATITPIMPASPTTTPVPSLKRYVALLLR